MTLSILICCVSDRFESFRTIYEKVQKQSEGKDVEILAFMDNRKRTIGRKRTGIMKLAGGRYFIMLDDDDDCPDDYVDELLKAIESDADIISFDQRAIVDGWGESTVNFSLQNENEDFNVGGITKRKPFSVCCFKTEKFQHLDFGDTNYGEDMIFSEQAWKIAESEHHVNKILHIYIASKK